MSDSKNMHKGHRERLKNRYIEEGLDHFNSINALELLLFYCVQRKDTNPLAHRLLERFGSFTDVLKATPDELMQVEGVTKHIAVFLSLIPATHKYYMMDEASHNNVLTTIDECVEYARPIFFGRATEAVYIICLNAACKVIKSHKISDGGDNAAIFPINEMVRFASGCRAASVLVVHNHPSGDPTPSADDIKITENIRRALDMVKICFVDHIVVTDRSYASISQYLSRKSWVKDDNG